MPKKYCENMTLSIRAMNTNLASNSVCVGFTVATINWTLPNSCIPLPNLIFRYCDSQTAGVIRRQSISAHIPHPSSPLIFTNFDVSQVHFNILSEKSWPHFYTLIG